MSESIRDDVLATVRRCVAESLAIDDGGIALQSRLIDDLGADSLDFVDIVFMLDRELDVRVQQTEFNFLTRLDFTSPEVMKGSYLTEAVVDRLSAFLPAIREVPDRAQVTPRQLFSLITVEAICIVCQRALERRA